MVHALLIEDDRKLASLLREFLAQHAVEATVAEDSVHALRELQAQRFDILLLDLMLPGMDGLSLTRRWSWSRGRTRTRLSTAPSTCTSAACGRRSSPTRGTRAT